MDRYEDSRPSEGQLYQAWKAAGGRPVDGDFSDGFGSDWLDHVQAPHPVGSGHLAARDTVAWGRLPNGLGYISLMACESLSEDEGGHADVLAARQVFDRVAEGSGGRPWTDRRSSLQSRRLGPGAPSRWRRT